MIETSLDSVSIVGEGDVTSPNNPPALLLSLTNSIYAELGTATPLFTRNDTDAYVVDFEGMVRQVGGYEARFPGARRVKNLVIHSIPLVANNWTGTTQETTTGLPDPYGGNTAVEITVDSLNFGYFNITDASPPCPAGSNITNSVWIMGIDIGGSDVLEITTGEAGDYVDVTSAVENGVWKRICPSVGKLITTDGGLSIKLTSTTYSKMRYACAQCENVTGQTDKNPGDFVSVGVSTGEEQAHETGFTNTNLWYRSAAAYTPFVNGVVDVYSTTAIGEFYIRPTGPAVTIPTGATVEVSVTIQNYVTGTVALGDTQLWYLSSSFNTNGTHKFTFTNTDGTDNNEPNLILAGTWSGSNWVIDLEITEFSVKFCDHGAFSDGVKYFDYENGNTTTSYVVTEAEGSALTTCKGYLGEEPQTNLALYSDTMSQWSEYGIGGTATKTLNYGVAPTGKPSTTYRLQASSSLSEAGANWNNALTGYYTFSIWVKPTTAPSVQIWIGDNGITNYVLLDYEFATGTITDGDTGWTSYKSAIDHGNGWYEFTISTTASVATYTYGVTVIPTVDIDIEFWNPQIVNRRTSTTPIITTGGSTVARNADALRYSPESYAENMTIYLEFETTQLLLKESSLYTIFNYYDDAGTCVCLLRILATGIVSVVRTNTSYWYVESGVSALPIGTHKAIFRSASTGASCACFIDGERLGTPSVAEDVSSLAIDHLSINARYGTQTTTSSNVPIKNFRVYHTLLSDEVCQEMTK